MSSAVLFSASNSNYSRQAEELISKSVSGCRIVRLDNAKSREDVRQRFNVTRVPTLLVFEGTGFKPYEGINSIYALIQSTVSSEEREYRGAEGEDRSTRGVDYRSKSDNMYDSPRARKVVYVDESEEEESEDRSSDLPEEQPRDKKVSFKEPKHRSREEEEPRKRKSKGSSSRRRPVDEEDDIPTSKRKKGREDADRKLRAIQEPGEERVPSSIKAGREMAMAKLNAAKQKRKNKNNRMKDVMSQAKKQQRAYAKKMAQD
jgi:hypothetical protein